MATSRILDQHGQPIDTGPLREAQSVANTRYISTEHDSHPSSGLTPRHIHSILTSAEQGDLVALQDLADDMQERDGQIYSVVQQRITAVASRDITITPPKGATEAERQTAARVQGMLDDCGCDLNALATDLLDGIYKGFSAVEQWFAPEGALMAPRWEARQQRIFTVRNVTLNPVTATPDAGQWLDGRNELRLRTTASTDGEALRPYNWIIHRHKAKNGYLAKQILARVLVWPYILKHYSQRDFAEFLEIYGLPLRLGTYPAGASDADKRVLLRAVSEIGHNAAGIIPSGMVIDFKEAAKGMAAPFMDMTCYQDEMIAKIVLGQTLTSGEGQHGTQALGNVHAQTRDLIRNADAQAVAMSMTRDMLWPFVQFNVAGIDPRRMPSVHIDTKDPKDMTNLADGLGKLVAMGVRVGKTWAQEEAGIPVPADGEEVLTAPAAAPVQDAAQTAQQVPGKAQDKTQAKANAKAQLAALVALAAQAGAQATTQASAAPATRRDALDDLVNEMMDEWEPTMGGLVQPLLDATDTAIEDGESINSFMDRLPALLGRMDASALAELLTRAGFVANTAGQAGVNIAGKLDGQTQP
jgi:phage gp29-like protein